MGSFSIWHWLIVLLVVVLIFGTKKLKNIGSDSVAEPDAPPQQVGASKKAADNTVDVEARTKS